MEQHPEATHRIKLILSVDIKVDASSTVNKFVENLDYTLEDAGYKIGTSLQDKVIGYEIVEDYAFQKKETFSGENIYLSLYHGREEPDQELEGWGSNGPVFGPYNGITGTYASDMKLHTNYDDIHWLHYIDDLLYYDGMYYGDFEIITEKQYKTPEFTARLKVFDQKLADKKEIEK